MLQDLCELIRMKLYASFLYQILHKWGFIQNSAYKNGLTGTCTRTVARCGTLSYNMFGGC